MNPVVILTALLGGVILTALFGFPALLWSTQRLFFWSLIVVLAVTAVVVRRKSSL